MRNDLNQAMVAMDMLIASFDASHKHDLGPRLHPNMESIANFTRFHTKVWHSIEANTFPGTRHPTPNQRQNTDQTDISRRYMAAMKRYCAGTLPQVQHTTLSDPPHVGEVLLRRRQSVFVLTLFALVEFAHDIGLPDEVYDEDLMRDIRALGVDITMLHNALMSYHKEESEEVPHNVIVAYRVSGKTAQEAIDLVGAELERKLSLFECTIEGISRWKSPRQCEIMRYVQGVKDVIKANLYWSLHSDRFLSEEQKIRLQTTGMVEVSAWPSYLRSTESTMQWSPSSPDALEARSESFRTVTPLDDKTVAPMDINDRTMTLYS